MEILFYILIGMLAIAVWSIINEKLLLKKLKVRLKNEWTKIPEEEYTSEKLESIKKYYLSIKDDRSDIDDITWNDLDMDEVYMQINNTQSAIGEEYLYALLRKPCFVNDRLNERNRLMNFFHSEEEKRIELQVKLNRIGKLRGISVYEYINRLGDSPAGSSLSHIGMAFALIASIILIFIKPAVGGIFTFLTAIVNIYNYYMQKAKIEKNLTIFSYILRLLDNIGGIIKSDIPEIQAYTDKLRQNAEVFKRFKRGASVLVSKNVNGSLMEAILDYIRMLFHVDLIKYNSMLSFLQKNRTVLNIIYANIGLLDSMLAASSFRDRLDYYCIPELTGTGRPQIIVNELYHPFLDDPVPNSINENSCVLLTGSNASGKSTFIKTIAINAALSQTIDTSLSRYYKANFFMIFSSMALRDNILQNESYYIVEIKSLKRILDHVNNDIPMLCLIDEVLRGTNTLERIAASSRILLSLARQNTLCFAATHDIELTHILEDYYSNYHFQEKIEGNQIIFDYKLYKGRAVSKNAIRLLGLLGYSPDIIRAAEKAAEDFVIDGEWKKIN